MNEVISNAALTVEIAAQGAEIQSIRDADGLEYIWQGDPAYWSRRAINLFPYVGRLTERRYTYRGQSYGMDIHGFLKDSEMAVVSRAGDRITFELRDSEETRKAYPFAFVLRAEYTLRGSRLEIAFRVNNSGSDTMYFGIGGHPGFRVPMEAGRKFEDYCIEFGSPCNPVRVGMSDDCFVTDADSALSLEDGRRLPLSHALFDDDAVILKEMDRRVTLKCRDGGKAVAVDFPGMPYLGLWHKPHSDAPYVCIEPWVSLPARKGVVEDLSTAPGLVALPPGEEYTNVWGIEVLR
jgi:galactose mutarotase-like enzyme